MMPIANAPSAFEGRIQPATAIAIAIRGSQSALGERSPTAGSAMHAIASWLMRNQLVETITSPEMAREKANQEAPGAMRAPQSSAIAIAGRLTRVPSLAQSGLSNLNAAANK